MANNEDPGLKCRDSVFLIGFMGAGKSLLGGPLAEALGLAYFDLDQQLVLEFGCSISDFFARYGEPEFRKREQQLLARLPRPAVVSLGGGAITTPALRDWLTVNGRSVFLDWPYPVLLARVKGDPNRPLAQDPQQLEALYQARLPLYRQADLIWQPGHTLSQEIAEIVGWIKEKLVARS